MRRQKNFSSRMKWFWMFLVEKTKTKFVHTKCPFFGYPQCPLYMDILRCYFCKNVLAKRLTDGKKKSTFWAFCQRSRLGLSKTLCLISSPACLKFYARKIKKKPSDILFSNPFSVSFQILCNESFYQRAHDKAKIRVRANSLYLRSPPPHHPNLSRLLDSVPIALQRICLKLVIGQL